ncbi:MAG: hypothetical protein ACI9X0_000336 [Kiritimatiellia bacterium]|jgi:hypothetical protein
MRCVLNTIGGGMRGAVWVLIAISVVVSLFVGMQAPQPMVGDEVTHYYMLTGQAEDLSHPNFLSKIPLSFGGTYERLYPHSFGWHYLGAMILRITGGGIGAVQFYQAFFWFQLLVACYLLAASRGGNKSGVSLLFVSVVATLPMGILFSIVFYQDVPLAAQIVTAFLFLTVGHWLVAVLFMAFAMFLKINAFVFLPVFLAVLSWQVWHNTGADEKKRYLSGRKWRVFRTTLALAVAVTLLGGASFGLQTSLRKYAQADFYPVTIVLRMMKDVGLYRRPSPVEKHSKETVPRAGNQKRRVTHAVITNHPGDLRFARNWIIYFGGILWLVVLIGGVARLFPAGRVVSGGLRTSTALLWVVGLGGLIPTAVFLKTAPDARFFLPALPFLILPFCEWVSRLSWRKWIFGVLIVMGCMQAGGVYWKTHSLRRVSPGIHEAIAFLESSMPEPPRIFMYPEGNYRLFPCSPEWYLGYGLREFWAGNNDARLAMLHKHKVGAVVVKKHLVAPIDKDMHNLGVYPPEFVADLRADSRFKKVLENEDVVIFVVPGSGQTNGVLTSEKGELQEGIRK